MTRQRRWQIARKARGLCVICGRPAVTRTHCRRHNEMHKAYVRKSRGRAPYVWAP